MSEAEDRTVLEQATRLLQAHALCDRCLGRLFGWLGTDTTNVERGRAIKLVLTMDADLKLRAGDREQGMSMLSLLAGPGMFQPARIRAERESIDYVHGTTCYLCYLDDCVFDRIPGTVEKALDISRDVEFGNFLVGSIPIPILAERQDELAGAQEILHAETLKSDFNREFGKILQRELKKPVEFAKPDIVIVYDMEKDSLALQINPLFVSGRYRKLARGIPQSLWSCGECNGKGCDACNNTGRKYSDSISEYVGIPAKEAFQGTRFKFHAAGREDIDVLMLGSGRPFVVEISEPQVRNIDFHSLTERVKADSEGKIEVSGLAPSDRASAQHLKEQASRNIKEYHALISTESEVDEQILAKAMEQLRDIELSQRTPNRVKHRRSDLVRIKHIYEVQLDKRDTHVIEGTFKVQGGTYVKELISGDNGRTTPSLAELLGTPCTCSELTVTAIHS